MKNILGIHTGHNSTAALLQDGKVVRCISEERFNREKNYNGFPAEAVHEALQHHNIKPEEIDGVAISGTLPTAFLFPTTPGLNKNFGAFTKFKRSIAKLETTIPAIRALSELYLSKVVPKREAAIAKSADSAMAAAIGMAQEKIKRFDHHLSHGATVYYGMCPQGEKILIFSADGGGDMLCSTVSIGENGTMHRIAHTPDWSSLGGLYSAVTQYLGMKPVEHEYKVMGMAPYAKERYLETCYNIFASILQLDEKSLTFRSSLRTFLAHDYLIEALQGQRFDSVCGAIQKFTEDFLIRWVKAGIQQTGIRKIALTGGVFMNVKANMLIANLPEVDEVFIMPSGGDESIAMGAAFLMHEEMRSTDHSLPAVSPIRDLYLGNEYSDNEIEEYIQSERLGEEFDVTKPADLEHEIAVLLSKHQVVARFNGRMEWGARALGNRSILANPSAPDTIRIINEQIKSRDFWMPFAGSILEERANDYLVNPKQISAPYMVVTFQTTPLAQAEMRAAMHPYDFTIRPQIISREWNPSYHHLVKEFEALTGIGGVLNTSLNLHGEPVVCSPADALHTLRDSGLQHLALGRFLISKRK